MSHGDTCLFNPTAVNPAAVNSKAREAHRQGACPRPAAGGQSSQGRPVQGASGLDRLDAAQVRAQPGRLPHGGGSHRDPHPASRWRPRFRGDQPRMMRRTGSHGASRARRPPSRARPPILLYYKV